MNPGRSFEDPKGSARDAPGAAAAAGDLRQPDVRSEAGFAAAVRQALRDFHRPDVLRDSPLLASRLVTAALQREPTTPPTHALRTMLREHCERLGENARSERYKQVLVLTYLAPLRSQQTAAEALHLSWSTYRRRLVEATRMLAASLWEAETSASPLPEAPDPAPPEGSAAGSAASAGRRAWIAAVAALAFLLLLGGGGLLLRASRARKPPGVAAPRASTVAVLPFLDLDHVPAMRYLSDGMTDELIMRLGRIPALRVVAPTSSFSLRGKPMDARQVGRLLGAASLVEGSVHRIGSLLHIDVMLVDTADGYERWTDEFTVDAGDVGGAEGMIVRGIADQLHVAPPPPDFVWNRTGAEVNPQARDFYLVGLEYLNSRDPGDILQAIAYLHKATQADGSYAPAWANLAMAYAVIRSYQAGVRPDTYYQDAFAAARKAIALDPALPRAYEVLGLLDDQHWHWRDAGRNYRRALQLDPSDATAHQWYAIHLWFMGRMQAALLEMRIARRLDPLSPIINADLGRALCYAGNLQASLAQYRATAAIAPNFALTYAFMGETDLALGDPRAALAAVHQADRLWGRTPQYALAEIGASEALLGHKGGARRALDTFEQRASHRYVSGVLVAWLDWRLGQKARTFDALRRAVSDHDFLMMFVFGPLGAGVRADPQFTAIRSLMNLPTTSAGLR
ncbi:hypothetical protein [Thiomonas sp.]|uniref:hypothetical protein n=1 Tax=Thiomonas sp. TaxID=2047785 RepID=UPI002620685A|nr:hypothetical protein [Thiomonas sp.]